MSVIQHLVKMVELALAVKLRSHVNVRVISEADCMKWVGLWIAGFFLAKLIHFPKR